MLLWSPMTFFSGDCIKTVDHIPVRFKRVLFLRATISVFVGLTNGKILIPSAVIALLINDVLRRKSEEQARFGQRLVEWWPNLISSSFDIGGVALDTSSNKDQGTRTMFLAKGNRVFLNS